MSPIPDRAALRSDLRQRRRALAAPARMAAADSLADRLLALPWLPARGYVAGYWATDGEIALHAVQLRLAAQLAWCLPVLDGDRLRFAPWRQGDALATNRFGIPEPDVAPSATLPPEALSLALMPMVGFGADGTRLGMGGGWYDRSFGFRQASAAPPWLVGVAFDEQQVDTLVPAPWDVVPDAICTPTRTLHRQ